MKKVNIIYLLPEMKGASGGAKVIYNTKHYKALRETVGDTPSSSTSDWELIDMSSEFGDTVQYSEWTDDKAERKRQERDIFGSYDSDEEQFGLDYDDLARDVPIVDQDSEAEEVIDEELMTSVQPDLSYHTGVHGPRNHFFQFFTHSDKLSSYMSQDLDLKVEKPFSMKTHFMEQKKPEKFGYQVLKEVRPLFAWISPPQNRKTKTKEGKESRIPFEKLATFTVTVAKSQQERGRYYAFAYNWNSEFWDTKVMTEFLKDQRNEVTKIYLNTYDPRLSPKHCIALVHNLPKSQMDVLKFGPYRIKASQKGSDDVELEDNYPCAFCEKVHEIAWTVLDQLVGKRMMLPRASNIQTSLMVDLLEGLDQEELISIDKVINLNDYPGIGNVAQTLSAVTMLPPVLPTRKDVKDLITWINSRPKGTVINFNKKENQDTYPEHTVAIKELRKSYFPNHWFEHCIVYRGRVPKIQHELPDKGEHAAVIMWRKTDKHKRLYVSTLKTLSQKGFDPLSWSVVLYFNTPSASDFEQATTKPQPMIPNQVELVPDVAPTPEEKIYGDPDEPLPGRTLDINRRCRYGSYFSNCS